MPNWLLGRIFAPFVMMALMYCVTRPASRFVARRMRESWLKRLLLIHSERDKLAYAIGSVTLVVGLYAGLFMICHLMGL